MTKLIEMFRLAKLVDMQDGEIDLMGTPVNIIPTHILCYLQKDLIEALGFRKAYEKIYAGAKEGARKYNQSFIEKYGFRDKRKTLDWQIKIVTSAGWGKSEVAFVDFKEDRAVIRYDKSPLPREYGRVEYPACILPTAFTAGGACVALGTDQDAVETKCMVMGSPFCEIEIGSPDRIAELRERLWREWGI